MKNLWNNDNSSSNMRKICQKNMKIKVQDTSPNNVWNYIIRNKKYCLQIVVTLSENKIFPLSS